MGIVLFIFVRLNYSNKNSKTQNPVPSRACRFDPGRRYKELRCYFILVFCLKLNSNMAIVAKWLTHRIVAPALVGSIPIVRPNEDSAEDAGSFFA